MRSFVLVGAMVGTVILFTAALCAPPPKRPTATLRLVVSGELNGHLAPCGCSSPQMGGLPRRVTLLRRLARQGAVVAIDAGDLIAGWGRQQEMKAETAVDLLAACGEDAIGLGERDLALGPEFVEALAQRSDGRLLCANLVGPSGERPFAPSRRITRRLDGHTVGMRIVAVIDPAIAADAMRAWSGWQVEPPSAALARLAKERHDPRDLNILIYHGPAAGASRVAAGFRFVIAAHEGDHPGFLGPGEQRIVHAGSNGRAVLTAMAIPGARWRVSTPVSRLLDPALPDDPVAARFLQAYEQRVAAEGLLEKESRVPLGPNESFAGSDSCAPCHAEPYRIWRASGHSDALTTLAKVSHDRDPECVSCHVVGLDRVGGYRDTTATPALASVGCESCHGPGGRHVRDPKVRLPEAGERSCLACHVPDQSPRFRFTDYWPRIRH